MTSTSNPIDSLTLMDDIEEVIEEECQLPPFFKEYNRFQLTLDELISNKDNAHVQLKQLISMVEPYQQQPTLLDPHLKEIIDKIMIFLKTEIVNCQVENSSKQSSLTKENLLFHHNIFVLLYHLMKIRSYKTIRIFLSHETSDLEPFFFYLLEQIQLEPSLWETTYVLLIWLSMICIVPLDLAKIDSGYSSEMGHASLVDHIVDICKKLLVSRGKPSEGAVIVLGKLLTRKDLTQKLLPKYLSWAQTQLADKKNKDISHGILKSLVTILKEGSREDLSFYIENFLNCLLLDEAAPQESSNALIRKAKLKLAQQIGLSYLKPRIASWRYQRGMRSLISSKISDENNEQVEVSIVESGLSNEEFPVPEAVEALIGIMFEGIIDKESTCRWSAAKGLGRLTQRLPFSLAEDIINYLIALFDENVINNDSGEKNYSGVNETTWHGACLTLAELARRGLLPRDKLETILALIIEALHLDIRRGSHSVGSIVRDSACYVFWSFARAYPASVFNLFSLELAQKLIISSVYDREINVRRASSAAFQEFVGRMQLFPHGIEVMALTDYFAVGNLSNSFLRASVLTSHFLEYRTALFKHLYTVSFRHWDISIRKLASKALARIALLESDASISLALTYLISQLRISDLATKHGSILAIGEISKSWSTRLNLNNPASSVIYEDSNDSLSFNSITDSVKCFSERELNTFGSELIREALCVAIFNFSFASWPIEKKTRDVFKYILDTSLFRKELNVQTCAAQALGVFSRSYTLYEEEFNSYLNGIKIESDIKKRGLALAIGEIQMKDDTTLFSVVNTLSEAAHIVNIETDTRTSILTGLCFIVSRLISGDLKCVPGIVDILVYTFFFGLEDYTTTNRGDVGSQVRKVSIEGLSLLVDLGCKTGNGLLIHHVPDITKKLLQQSVEKIDRIRLAAGKATQNLLKNYPSISNYQDLAPLLDSIDWQSPSEVFPRVMPILESSFYRLSMLIGLITSAGSLTESLIRYAGGSFVDFLLSTSLNILQAVAEDLIFLLKTFALSDRIIIPLMEVFRMSLEAELFQGPGFIKFSSDLATSIKHELKACKIPRKIILCAKIMCHLSCIEQIDVRRTVWSQLLRLLTHSSANIRIVTSENLYLILSCSSEAGGDIENLLLETDWTQPIAQLREVVFPLYSEFGLNAPKLIKR